MQKHALLALLVFPGRRNRGLSHRNGLRGLPVSCLLSTRTGEAGMDFKMRQPSTTYPQNSVGGQMVYSARERINSRSVIPGTTRLSAAFRFVTSAWGSTGAKWATGLRLLGLVLALGAVIPPSHAQNTKRLDTVRHTMADRPYDWREERPCGSCYAPICHRGLNPCGGCGRVGSSARRPSSLGLFSIHRIDADQSGLTYVLTCAVCDAPGQPVRRSPCQIGLWCSVPALDWTAKNTSGRLRWCNLRLG